MSVVFDEEDEENDQVSEEDEENDQVSEEDEENQDNEQVEPAYEEDVNTSPASKKITRPKTWLFILVPVVIIVLGVFVFLVIMMMNPPSNTTADDENSEETNIASSTSNPNTPVVKPKEKTKPDSECGLETYTCTEGCTPAQDSNCECEADIECMIDINNPLLGGKCNEYSKTCNYFLAPEEIEISGDLRAFCSAYVNGCQEASIIIKNNSIKSIIEIDAEGRFSPEACDIAVTSSNGFKVMSATYDVIGDSVEACVQNAQVHFFDTVNSEDCIDSPCSPGFYNYLEVDLDDL